MSNMYAISRRTFAMCSQAAKSLLKYGASIEVKDSRGKTPLDLALTSGNDRMSDIFYQNISVSIVMVS